MVLHRVVGFIKHGLNVTSKLIKVLKNLLQMVLTLNRVGKMGVKNGFWTEGEVVKPFLSKLSAESFRC